MMWPRLTDFAHAAAPDDGQRLAGVDVKIGID